MRSIFILWAIFLSIQGFAAETLFSCVSDKSKHDNPNILIEGVKGQMEIELVFDRDWVRSEGRLPAGRYPGVLVPSPSVKDSAHARMDVERYFSNQFKDPLGSTLDLSLRLVSSPFMVEAYVLWPTKHSEFNGLILNGLACKMF